MSSKFRNWIRGLVGGAIGGGAGAVLASLGLAGAAAVGIEVTPLDWKQIAGVFLSGSVIAVFMFLKQSPLPPPEEDDQVTP